MRNETVIEILRIFLEGIGLVIKLILLHNSITIYVFVEGLKMTFDLIKTVTKEPYIVKKMLN